jgi:phosphoenolpyruvate phosphomutase
MSESKSVRMNKPATNGHTVTAPNHNLAARLFDGKPKLGVGVYDGLSSLIAARHGFDFLWVSSFSCSAAAGLPDVGIIGAEEILATVRSVRRLTTLPIVVDLDAGYGDPVKIYHVVDAMVRAGASALCIEDNPTSKRCSLYPGYKRDLASITDHVARVRAALEAVAAAGSDCRIIARTEALVAGMGGQEAHDRATAYADAGANAVFVQSLDATGEDVLTFGRQWSRRTPIFIAPTRFPQITRTQFIKAGISHQIFANHGIRAAHGALEKTLSALSKAESSMIVEKEISAVSAVAASVGAEKVSELEDRVANHKSKPSSRKVAVNGSRRKLAKPAKLAA